MQKVSGDKVGLLPAPTPTHVPSIQQLNNAIMAALTPDRVEIVREMIADGIITDTAATLVRVHCGHSNIQMI
jgi:hypothetical protein